MNKRKVSQYTIDFKQSSSKLAAESDQPISQTASELGINPSTLYAWVKKYEPITNSKSLVTAPDTAQAELLALRKKLARVEQERDILKKAAAYFAGEMR